MIREWWIELRVDGWAGYRLASKLKLLNGKIKEWVKTTFGDVLKSKETILKEIQAIDKEETIHLLPEEVARRLSLKKKFLRKPREAEIKWKQRSWCQWLKDGDRNIIFSRNGLYQV